MGALSWIIDPPIVVVCALLLAIAFAAYKRLDKGPFAILLASALLSFLAAEGVCRLMGAGSGEKAFWAAVDRRAPDRTEHFRTGVESCQR